MTTLTCEDLKAFIHLLKEQDELIEINTTVSCDLEITEITDTEIVVSLGCV